jgi:Tfp pilus assembly protein PilN
MIATIANPPYHLNLIRSIREREKKSERRKRLAFILTAGCFGFFALSTLYSALTIWQMESVITQEKDKLSHLKQEYQKYTATKMIVDKSDVELLGSLQGKGVFWTRKLAVMAKDLPDNYWITRFSYQNEVLSIGGFGLAGPQQGQLLVLNDYVNSLKQDTAFADIFKDVRLVKVDRTADGNKIAFELAAHTANWRGN